MSTMTFNEAFCASTMHGKNVTLHVLGILNRKRQISHGACTAGMVWHHVSQSSV